MGEQTSVSVSSFCWTVICRFLYYQQWQLLTWIPECRWADPGHITYLNVKTCFGEVPKYTGGFGTLEKTLKSWTCKSFSDYLIFSLSGLQALNSQECEYQLAMWLIQKDRARPGPAFCSTWPAAVLTESWASCVPPWSWLLQIPDPCRLYQQGLWAWCTRFSNQK